MSLVRKIDVERSRVIYYHTDEQPQTESERLGRFHVFSRRGRALPTSVSFPRPIYQGVLADLPDERSHNKQRTKQVFTPPNGCPTLIPSASPVPRNVGSTRLAFAPDPPYTPPSPALASVRHRRSSFGKVHSLPHELRGSLPPKSTGLPPSKPPPPPPLPYQGMYKSVADSRGALGGARLTRVKSAPPSRPKHTTAHRKLTKSKSAGPDTAGPRNSSPSRSKLRRSSSFKPQDQPYRESPTPWDDDENGDIDVTHLSAAVVREKRRPHNRTKYPHRSMHEQSTSNTKDNQSNDKKLVSSPHQEPCSDNHSIPTQSGLSTKFSSNIKCRRRLSSKNLGNHLEADQPNRVSDWIEKNPPVPGCSISTITT